MLHKLVSEQTTKEHEAKWGRFNDCPPGFQEITAEEFAQSGFFTWCKEAQEFRQVDCSKLPKGALLSPVQGLFAITMFYMNHGEHFALGHDYWAKKVRYFKFADCYHDYVEISAKEAGKPAFNCYHYYKCSKCGHHWEVDSSG